MNPENQNDQPSQSTPVTPEVTPQPAVVPAQPGPEQPQVAQPVAPVQQQPVVSQPAAPLEQGAGPSSAAAASKTDPATVILQWLTYAFWGWTILALSVLTTTVINSFMNSNDSDNFTAYGIAAVLVLLPISYAVDYFYSKREPVKKAGPELLIMVIHAVLFAVFGIGALIWAVISVVILMTSSEDSTGAVVSLLSALVVTFYYSLVLLRTINVQKLAWFTTKFKLVMLVTVGLIAVLGIVGPVAKERSTRDDRLIENNLYSLQSAIDDYARDNKRLPDSLSDLDLDAEEKKLVDKRLVTFKPEGSSTASNESIAEYYDNGTSDSSVIQAGRARVMYRYQLCATYKHADKDRYSSRDSLADSDGYSTYISTSSHPAGEVCYKLKTD
jgi:hypothetical protein